jgi:hypothetical protein
MLFHRVTLLGKPGGVPKPNRPPFPTLATAFGGHRLAWVVWMMAGGQDLLRRR